MPLTQGGTQSQEFVPHTKFVHLWQQSNIQNGGKNHFFLNQGHIIGKVSFSPVNLRTELAWLTYLRPRVSPEKVVLPEPIGSVVEDDGMYCLYLRVIPGQTLEKWIEKNGPLSDRLAHSIADAYLALREAGAPDSGNDYLIPRGLMWEVMGHVFNEDNEAECELRTRTAFNTMMNERFQAGIGLNAVFPVASPAFIHGDLSPTNILLAQDNRIAIVDFGYSAWLPEYWDAYVLSKGIYTHPKGFLEPIREALKEKGIWMSQDDPKRVLMESFDSWSKSQKGRWYLRSLRKRRSSPSPG